MALHRLTPILEAEGIPYAIIGAFALNEYGHRRVTVDVNLVMREEQLQAFRRRHLGHGYTERVPGTGKLFDTQYGVNIDVLSTGRFPGENRGRPPPVGSFQVPRAVAARAGARSFLRIGPGPKCASNACARERGYGCPGANASAGTSSYQPVRISFSPSTTMLPRWVWVKPPGKITTSPAPGFSRLPR